MSHHFGKMAHCIHKEDVGEVSYLLMSSFSSGLFLFLLVFRDFLDGHSDDQHLHNHIYGGPETSTH